MADKTPFEPYVAVDIGSFSLKFIYIVPGTDNKPVLKALAHMNIPPFAHMLTQEEREKMSREDVEKDSLTKLQKFLTKHLTELLYDNQIQTKKAVTLASGRVVTIRYFEIPPVPEKEAMDVAINAEAQKQMPFSMENAVFGYTVLGDTVRNEKAFQQIMVAALQKDVVPIMSDNLKGGGLANEGILTLPQALELGIPHQLGINSNKESKIAVIHCGHKTTSIMVYKNGKLNFYRDINMAGETITDAIFAGGEVDGQKIQFKNYEEATELKHKIGILPPDEIQTLKGIEKFAAQAIFSTVEKIFQHIQLSISFYISQFGESGIERIVLSGGSAAMKNFKEFIQESMEVPVEIADPLSNISISEINIQKEKLVQDAPAFSPGIGLALYKDQEKIINFINILFPNRKSQTLDFSSVSSKFTQGLGARFNITLDEKKIKILLVLFAILILLIGAYPFVKIRQDLEQAKKDYKKYEQELNHLRETQGEVTALLAEKDRLLREAAFSNVIMDFMYPNSEMLLELLQKTPSQIFILKFQILREGNDRRFRLIGHADTMDRVFEYIKLLSNGKFFKSTTLENSRDVVINQDQFFMEFTVTGKLEKPPPEQHSEATSLEANQAE